MSAPVHDEVHDEVHGEVSGFGTFLGPVCGDVELAVAELEARGETGTVTITVSRAAAEEYARYGVESSRHEIWRAFTDALAEHG